jgi:leucyl-tRNA synthetase
MGLVKFDEPFTRLMTQGMLLNHIFFRRTAKGGIDYYAPADVGVTHDAEGGSPAPVQPTGSRRVRRRRYDVQVEAEQRPADIIERYGADTARLFVMFAGSPQDSAVWSDAGVEGDHRFLRRLWAFAQNHAETVKAATRRIDGIDPAAPVKVARREVHLTLKQATYDYERVQYNTVISAGMKMLNALEAMPVDGPGASAFLREGLSILLRVLYPVAPHIAVRWRSLPPMNSARCSTRRGRRSIRPRSCRTIELSSGERQAARQVTVPATVTRRRSKARRADPPKS